MTGINPNTSIFIINTNSLICLLKDRRADGKYAELSWIYTKNLKWHGIEWLEINLISVIKKEAKNALLIMLRSRIQGQK